jgi:hypothetical protein
MMLFKVECERRSNGWYAYAPSVPGTGSLGDTREAAVAETFRKLADKTERRELVNLDVFIAEAPPPGMKPFTGADFLALWERLPHPDPGWADAVEEAVRNQPPISGQSPWDS